MDEALYNACPDILFSDVWDHYDWKAAETELFSLQTSLTKAVFMGNEALQKTLQKKIVNSLDVKMLAVRAVCETANSTGIDGERWVTSEDKGRAAFRLNPEHYTAKPYRHVIVETKKGRERPINIPTFFDRAMQKLYAYALNPVAEAKAERKSFGFRLGRSPHDANEYIKDAFTGENAPRYAFLSDVEACYASISHKWLLKNIPMDKRVLKAFLTAGYVFNGELFPSEEYGISIGSSLSPMIANMTLDGMQKYLFQALYHGGEIDFADGNLIRFADDILISLRSKETAQSVYNALNAFLSERGLRMSAKKTRVADVEGGFDFLSWHYVRKNGIMIVTPSEKAIKRFMEEIEELIFSHKGSQKALIDKINRKICGWTTYHRISDADLVFRKMDVYIKATLMKFCEITHPTWTKERILKNFWYKDFDGQHIYALKDRPEIRVQNISDTLLVGHKKIKTNANPYLDHDYIEGRNETRVVQNVTGKYHAVWERQKGKCFYCGKPILLDQKKMIVDKDVRFGDKLFNLAYIHAQCGFTPIEYIQQDYRPLTEMELIDLINSLDKGEAERNSKYGRLFDYFRGKTEPFITLTFQEIEKINESKLCKTAYEKNAFWFSTSETGGRISQSWLMNGYSLQRVDLVKKIIVLHRNTNEYIPVKIPEPILSGRIPRDAKFEIENFCRHIQEKYGL